MRALDFVRLAAITALAITAGTPLCAQVPDPAPLPSQPFAPGITYDPRIPTLDQVNGHAWGSEVSAHAEVEAYLRALAAAAPERLQLVQYGTSWQGRRLWYALVGSPQNLARLPDVQRGMQRLADPRGLNDVDADALVASLPAVGWLANCVHGDEPSGTDAATSTCSTTCWRRRGDPLVDAGVRRNCVLGVDPLQNPDGRDRFVHSDARRRAGAGRTQRRSAPNTASRGPAAASTTRCST